MKSKKHQIMGVNLIVEDKNREAIKLVLNNQVPDDNSFDEIKQLLKVGSEIIIK